MDQSSGYESIAAEWLEGRGKTKPDSNAIGVLEVRKWAGTLPHGSSVIDLGCGPGVPLTAVLVEEGLDVFGVDGSPSFVAAFKQNLPGTPVICESVLESSLFDRKFVAALSIGLMFLLKVEEQRRLIRRLADALVPNGRWLFTAPAEPHFWNDLMTGKESISLGAEEYRSELAAVGLSVIAEYEDGGQNHYFDALKAEQKT